MRGAPQGASRFPGVAGKYYRPMAPDPASPAAVISNLDEIQLTEVLQYMAAVEPGLFAEAVAVVTLD